MTFSKLAAGAFLVAGLAAAGSASAVTYSYSNNGGYGGSLANALDSYSTTFNSATNAFTFNTNFATNANGNSVDGYWLVLSDSSNPKGNQNLAFMVADFASRDLRVYRYDGANATTSATNARLITTFNDVLTHVGANDWTLSLTGAQGSQINSAFPGPSDGLAFGTKPGAGGNIGVWFHWFDGTVTNIRSQGYSDLDAAKTTQSCPPGQRLGGSSTAGFTCSGNPVPVPATLPLIGLGLIAAAAVAKRRRTV